MIGFVALPNTHHYTTIRIKLGITVLPIATQHPQAVYTNTHTHGHGHGRTEEPGPYREEADVLSSGVSKYPHVRQAFYKSQAVFNPTLQVGSGEGFYV